MKVYLAGPMRGYPEFNFPAFYRAAKVLRELEYEVLSPAEHDLALGFNPSENSLEGFDMQASMEWDLRAVLDSEAVVLLPGWRESTGVGVEVVVAKAVGRELLEYPGLKAVQEEHVTLEANRLVAGARQAAYGHPFDDFTRTGRMWGAILGIDDVPPHLVGLCQVALKISREVNAPKRDNRVDMCGYAETVDLVRERQELVARNLEATP
jgi:Domain of unknown function (DUF6378)/Domain of unknown function (DUF4406)